MGRLPESIDDEYVDVEIGEVIRRTRFLRNGLQEALDVTDKLLVALCIAEANPDNDRGADATARVHEYLEYLEKLGELGL